MESGGAATKIVALIAWVLIAAPAAPTPATAAEAKATIQPKGESKVTGTAAFTDVAPRGVKVVVDIADAPPGTHGLHIHEKGDCSAPDASSAGAHFNPAGNPHAGPKEKARHNGDLGNIEIGQNGKGHLEVVDDLLTVKPGAESVVGKSVVFHAKTDDLKTQPAGDSGARVGCGTIESARK